MGYTTASQHQKMLVVMRRPIAKAIGKDGHLVIRDLPSHPREMSPACAGINDWILSPRIAGCVTSSPPQWRLTYGTFKGHALVEPPDKSPRNPCDRRPERLFPPETDRDFSSTKQR
ncbi:hypothetical protein M2418_003867 [Rhizobium sp. BIGb0125]|jgi:hypothetical protein|uniref:hypothetical protein n=1 Tax=Rhizobium sp. BIGb0125 TaxID=2940618 RepID=UPI002169F43D|nr:hypothetical protein [Rhizobium sp. BIGb0125]MCS4244326.1 hypothetical protein [Rhizobium sp. BIGb0125]